MKNACKGVFHLFVLGFIFGFLGLGFWMGAKKRGGYYDPPPISFSVHARPESMNAVNPWCY